MYVLNKQLLKAKLTRRMQNYFSEKRKTLDLINCTPLIIKITTNCAGCLDFKL